MINETEPKPQREVVEALQHFLDADWELDSFDDLTASWQQFIRALGIFEIVTLETIQEQSGPISLDLANFDHQLETVRKQAQIVEQHLDLIDRISKNPSVVMDIPAAERVSKEQAVTAAEKLNKDFYVLLVPVQIAAQQLLEQQEVGKLARNIREMVEVIAGGRFGAEFHFFATE